MRTASLVDASTETASPAGVMQTVAAAERHPVGYKRSIRIRTVIRLRAAQCAVALLALNAVYTGNCAVILRRIAGYAVAAPQAAAVAVEIHFLYIQINFHIFIAPVRADLVLAAF